MCSMNGVGLISATGEGGRETEGEVAAAHLPVAGDLVARPLRQAYVGLL